MNKPTGSYSSWENTMCNSLAPIGEKTRLAWHDGYASAKTEWQGLTDEDKNQIAKKAYNKVELTAWELAQRVGEFTEDKLKEKNT